jgi:hypothetical protein
MTQVSPTVHVQVGGDLRLHPWIDPEMSHEDAYSLFVARSAQMLWSSSGSTEARWPQLWGMNDAAIDLAAVSPTPVAWFQVSATRDAPPVGPVLACVGDVLDRFGALRLESVRVFLPPAAGAGDVGDTVRALNWFELNDPNDLTSIRITVEGPDRVGSPEHASLLATQLERINTGRFGFGAVVAERPAGLSAVRTALGVDWLPAERGRVTLMATVPEWSFDALGWVVGVVVVANRLAGADAAPLVIEIEREGLRA